MAALDAEGEPIGAKRGLFSLNPLHDLVRAYLSTEPAFLASFQVDRMGHMDLHSKNIYWTLTNPDGKPKI
jgi:hypothetical protein